MRLEPDCGVEGASRRADPEESGRESRLPPADATAAVGPCKKVRRCSTLSLIHATLVFLRSQDKAPFEIGPTPPN